MQTLPIEIDNVVKTYGPLKAVDGISLNVRAGEMFGLIGHNGAGKSTLFKLMLGLIPATSGALRLHGVATNSAQFRAARRRIGYLPESFVTYDNLSAIEVLTLFSDLKRVPRETCAEVLERVGLSEAAERRVQTFSKGMRQRLGLAQVLLGDPDLIFLDEPTNGLDPAGIADFYAILRAAQARGATIVITSHILAEIQERVDRLAILQGGKVAALGTLAELRARVVLPSVIEATLHAGYGARADLRQALALLPDVEACIEGDHARIACPPARKVAVLAALGASLRDLTIREPSLEQLFLGYGGAHGQH